MRVFLALSISSTVFMISTAVVTLKDSIIVHGIAASLMFLSNISLIAVATSLQSYMVYYFSKLKLSSDQVEVMKAIKNELALKRRVLLSLICFGVGALLSNLALYVSNVLTSAQLSETTGPILQYVTVVHILVAHISFVNDIKIHMS